MAGTNPGFSAEDFNAAIRYVMGMGAPPTPGEEATFHFARTTTQTVPAAEDGVPFAPGDVREGEEPAPVTVPCAVESVQRGLGRGEVDSNLGIITPTRITVTLLEDDYRQVASTAYVVIAGDRYDYRSTEAPMGLFDVGVWVMHFTSPQDV